MIGVVLSMSVLERRREIGILRAVGARRRDIARLFLVEAAVIGAAGGVAGVAVGGGAGWLANAMTRQFAHATQALFVMPVWLAVLGIGFGVAASLVAGWAPASRAARLHPVEALRAD